MAVRTGMGFAPLLPRNVESGRTILNTEANKLLAAPDVELALYLRYRFPQKSFEHIGDRGSFRNPGRAERCLVVFGHDDTRPQRLERHDKRLNKSPGAWNSPSNQANLTR